MPEITENLIRIPNPKHTESGCQKIRTIDISVSKGIKALYCIDHTKIKTYLFDKTKWTLQEAQAWVKEHEKYNLDGLVKMYEEINLSIDTDKKITKFFKPEIKVIDSSNHIAKMYVTNEDIDRDKEILLLSSWKKRIGTFKEHPVLLSSHKYNELQSQIGEAVNIGFDDKGMWMNFKWYAGEGNAEADWGWKLAEKGKAMASVGFIPYQVWEGDAIPEKYREKEPKRVYAENELLEVSQVVVGSNRGALQILGIPSPTVDQCQYMYEVVKDFGAEIPEFEEKKIEQKIIESKKEEKKEETNQNNHSMSGEKINQDSFILAPIEIQNMKDLQMVVEIWKSGRVISEKNKTIIKSAIEQLIKSVEILSNLIELTEPKNDGGDVRDEEEKFVNEVDAFFQRNLNNKTGG